MRDYTALVDRFQGATIMKIKSQYFFILVITALILGACSPAHSPNVIVASITATPSAQVVPTDLPPSPTAKPAPTEIPASPTPEFSVQEITTDQMKSPDTIIYTVADEAQIVELEKQMLTGPSKLDLVNGRPFRATVAKFGDGSSNIGCAAYVNESIAPWFAVTVMTESGPVNVILYELAVMVDNVPTRIVLRAVEARIMLTASGDGTWSNYTTLIYNMQFKNEPVSFNIMPEVPPSSGSLDNPIAREVIDVQGEQKNADRQRLLETGKYDLGMQDTLFWVGGIP
jgi:hypothetical protein